MPITKIIAGAALFSALVGGTLATTAAPALAQQTGTAVSAAVQPGHAAAAPDVGSPTEDAGNRHVPAVAPDGTRVASHTATRPAPPAAAGPANGRAATGRAQAAATYEWIEAHTIASGVRIRTSPVTGRILGTMPYGADMWVSCIRAGSDGYYWAWVAYQNPYGTWTAGWSRGDMERMVRGVILPHC